MPTKRRIIAAARRSGKTMLVTEQMKAIAEGRPLPEIEVVKVSVGENGGATKEGPAKL